MSIADLPIDETYDWRQGTLLEELHDAIIRRQHVVRRDPNNYWGDLVTDENPADMYISFDEFADHPGIGDELLLQRAPSVGVAISVSDWSLPLVKIQRWIEDNVKYFYDPVELGADPIQFGNLYAACPRLNEEKLRSQAGLSADGFKRVYRKTIESEHDAGSLGQRARMVTRENGKITGTKAGLWKHDGTQWQLDDEPGGPDVLEGYGLIEAGDYIGPWVFNEIGACLEVMRFIEAEGIETGDNYSIRRSSDDDIHPDDDVNGLSLAERRALYFNYRKQQFNSASEEIGFRLVVAEAQVTCRFDTHELAYGSMQAHARFHLWAGTTDPVPGVTVHVRHVTREPGYSFAFLTSGSTGDHVAWDFGDAYSNPFEYPPANYYRNDSLDFIGEIDVGK